MLYSEILDQYLSITCTRRARLLIDDAYGIDNYILKVRTCVVISSPSLGNTHTESGFRLCGALEL